MSSSPERFPADVVRALAAGDPRARERFFDHFYDRVYGYVVHTVRDEHLAEDLTHEIFLKLDASLARLDEDRDPASWVFTVAANAIRDHWRRSHTRAAARSVEIDESLDPPVDDAARVDETLVRGEEHARLHRALAELSEDDRQIVLLRTFGELPTERVAGILGVKPDAVRQRWSRAVRRLGDAYRAIESEEGGVS